MRKSLFVFPIFAAAVFIGFVTLINQTFGTDRVSQKEEKVLTSLPKPAEPEIVRELFSDFSLQYRLFKKAEVESGKFVLQEGQYKIFFTIEPSFQEKLEREFKRFKVKYGAFVALEPSTGKVLVAVTSLDSPDLLLKRSYPAASTFKIVTASAALELKVATPNTTIRCGGVGDSCSPSVWHKSKLMIDRTFTQSFATSANPFFGLLGKRVGKENLLKFAKLFGFNERSYNFPWGVFREPLDDYEVALMAAGLGDTTTSPFHQALIAQTILNGGVMMKPFLVEKVVDLRSGKVYKFKPEPFRRVISPETAREVERMMELTVKIGTTSNKRYFRLLRRKFPNLVIGGKTGTLTERSFPEGRCEWFTGFLKYGGASLAFSSVAVNQWLYYITGYEISAVAALDFAKLIQNQKGGAQCASSVK
jgi:cell division protein FtsI/penicillin-binding protein 2